VRIVTLDESLTAVEADVRDLLEGRAQ